MRLASKNRNRFHEPISVSSLGCVESRSLFIEITEKVKRFYRNVGAWNGPLQQTPEVFNAVRVNVTINVLFSVDHYVVDVAIANLTVRARNVGVDARSGPNALCHFESSG
jgi:hypothetical protein